MLNNIVGLPGDAVASFTGHYKVEQEQDQNSSARTAPQNAIPQIQQRLGLTYKTATTNTAL